MSSYFVCCFTTHACTVEKNCCFDLMFVTSQLKGIISLNASLLFEMAKNDDHTGQIYS